jgi:hypothetical protein
MKTHQPGATIERSQKAMKYILMMNANLPERDYLLTQAARLSS